MASESELRILIQLRDEATAGLRAIQNETRLVGMNMGETGESSKKAGLAIDLYLGQYALKALKMVGSVVSDAVKQFTGLGMEIGNMSIKTGIGTEMLSKLNYAAEVSGVSLQTIGTAIRGMDVVLAGARSGTTATAEAFARLHLNLKDIEAMAPADQFMTIANALSAETNATTRAGLATQVFGRYGQELLPILDNLAEKLQNASKYAHIFTPTDIATVQQTHAALTNLNESWKTLQTTAAIGFAPILQPAMTAVTTVIRGFTQIQEDNNKSVAIATSLQAKYEEKYGSIYGWNLKIVDEYEKERLSLESQLPTQEQIAKNADEIAQATSNEYAEQLRVVDAITKEQNARLAMYQNQLNENKALHEMMEIYRQLAEDRMALEKSAGGGGGGLHEQLPEVKKLYDEYLALNAAGRVTESWYKYYQEQSYRLGETGSGEPGENPLYMPTAEQIAFNEQSSRGPEEEFAVGGIVTHPTRALIGEAGPEAIVPLGQNSMPIENVINMELTLDGEVVTKQILRRAGQLYMQRNRLGG